MNTLFQAHRNLNSSNHRVNVSSVYIFFFLDYDSLDYDSLDYDYDYDYDSLDYDS